MPGTNDPAPATKPGRSKSAAPRPDRRREEVLIATLGLEPQVVTTALDLLLSAGRAIREVIVIHTTPPRATRVRTAQTADRLAVALDTLDTVFAAGRYRHAGREWSVGYRRVGLVARGRPVFDVRSADDAKSVFNAIHAEVRDRKRAGQRVHLCISGGRKSISAYGMAVAQLLFDHQDRLWHVASSERFQASGALHPTTAADASLVPVPVLALGLVHLAPMADLFATTEPQDLLQSVATAMAGDQRRRCRRFVTETLSTEERRLVKYFLSCVMEEHRSPTYGQIADALVLSERTVRNRFSSITAKLKLSFDYGASRVTTDVLVGLFAPHYFELDL